MKWEQKEQWGKSLGLFWNSLPRTQKPCFKGPREDPRPDAKRPMVEARSGTSVCIQKLQRATPLEGGELGGNVHLGAEREICLGPQLWVGGKKKRLTENLEAQVFLPTRGVWKYTIYIQGTPKGKLILSALLSKSPLVPGRCKGKIAQTPQDSHSQRNMIKSKNYKKLKKQTTWKGSTTTMQRFRTQMTHILKWSDTKYK